MSANSSLSNGGGIYPSQQGLYDPAQERDACGVGFIANIYGVRSRAILDGALTALKNLAHRGAIDADAVTGDGAGVMTQIPYALLADYLRERNKPVPAEGDLGVAMVFLPKIGKEKHRIGKKAVQDAVKAEGLGFLAWRKVPVDNSCLGRKAESTRPYIVQGLIARPESVAKDEFERRLFLVQKRALRLAKAAQLELFYIVSLSSKVITYKGLLNSPQVRKFFADLRSPKYETAFAIFHQRFATNTFPDWMRAQPFRMLAHNGEINTIRGNRNSMRAREFSSDHGIWGDRYEDVRPIIQEDMSDSASFDNCLQVMTVAGRPVAQGVAIMMPPAWEEDRHMDKKIRDFYKHHAVMMEPWDGPAAIVFSDGRFVGASLDRNGLRPARYKLHSDGTVVLASEVGLIPQLEESVVRSGRLGPGKMLLIDMQDHKLMEDREVKESFAATADYSAWCERHIHDLNRYVNGPLASVDYTVDPALITHLRVAHGYDLDEETMVLQPMLESAKEGVGSMGDDTPLAILSRRPRLLYTYFKQLFAQVTNPAIDSLRERTVMSLKMAIGGRLGVFSGLVQSHDFLALESPLLLDKEFEVLQQVPFLQDHTVQLDTTFPLESGAPGLEQGLNALRVQVRKLFVDAAPKLLVLTDRAVSQEKVAIPALLATGAVHSELVALGKRMECDIVVDTGEARDVHQVACLIGFGANAVYPRLALNIIRKIVTGSDSTAVNEKQPLDVETAFSNYRSAINAGLLKIMSKMGISALFSYQGAKIFEAVGIAQSVVSENFAGASCPIGGIGYEQIALESLRRHAEAFPQEGAPELWNEGYYTVNKKGAGEFHGWNAKVVSGMNQFLRKGGDFKEFAAYREASNVHQPVSIKDLLRLKFTTGNSVPLDQVESVEDIRRRFTTAGMSLGALSPEMHEALAIAMNRIGGKSNSGEGGEDPVRYRPYENGDNANSAIKQVASGRFGVTAEYLANAKEIEIKVAQGAKPGEGGQLPGNKVSPLIARLRYSVPGVTLISPPPHHDIYSIEDLAQLIFDLKEVNPRAKVCVKLVSSSGVGTIAAGVAKAYADVILISGHEGGTGASPLSSIKNAGSAWEIGLSEAHQVLMLNGLRSRVTLRTDGGMKTGRDIMIAALLGAEEYNFGTSALIAGGCAMFRICHTNNCPVGVATQRDDLRAKFRGKPEYIIQYFDAVAQDVRILMSKMGFRTMDELIGRTDCLEALEDPRNPKTQALDLGKLLYAVDPSWEHPRIHTRPRNDRFGNEGSLDDTILQEAKQTIVRKEPVFAGSYKVTNVNRNVGTRISGEVAYLHGNQGLKPGTIKLDLQGNCGQGLGTFLVQGIRLRLVGDANDYVGKGMNGGEIIIRPRSDAPYKWSENVIIGNTCLYGATGGYLFAAGLAGERFAVRNSGATAVVEGVGDHGCEYMTRGTVVCLGSTGRNFGAGMSGGIAFVYDPEHAFSKRYNPEMVTISRLNDSAETLALQKLISLHFRLTASPLAQAILEDWESAVEHFHRVAPITAPEIARPVFAYDKNLQEIS